MTIASIPTLYHFIDRRNLPSIRELGGLYSLARLNEMGAIIAAPGGNQWSHEADECRGLDRYVHRCFKPTNPMEFRAREDGRVGNSILSPDPPGGVNHNPKVGSSIPPPATNLISTSSHIQRLT